MSPAAAGPLSPLAVGGIDSTPLPSLPERETSGFLQKRLSSCGDQIASLTPAGVRHPDRCLRTGTQAPQRASWGGGGGGCQAYWRVWNLEALALVWKPLRPRETAMVGRGQLGLSSPSSTILGSLGICPQPGPSRPCGLAHCPSLCEPPSPNPLSEPSAFQAKVLDLQREPVEE